MVVMHLFALVSWLSFSWQSMGEIQEDSHVLTIPKLHLAKVPHLLSDLICTMVQQ